MFYGGVQIRQARRNKYRRVVGEIESIKTIL